MVEIAPAHPEEAHGLRIRQLAAIRRFLEAVVANRKAKGMSGLTGSVRPPTETGLEGTRAQGGAR